MVANIPYHITSPLLHGFLEGERPPELVVLLVQAEVAERIAAPPGQMSYLSVFAQNVAEVEIVARVPAAAFEPAPERRLGRPAPAPPAAHRWCLPAPRREPFYRLVQAGFRQRRKQLHNALVRELRRGPRGAGRGLCGLRGRARAARADAHARAVGLPRSTQLGPVLEARGMTPLRLDAPAKLNLSLAVTGRRADGFHELDSELVLLELADRLLLLPGCSGLRVEGEGSDDAAARHREPGLARPAGRRRPRARPRRASPWRSRSRSPPGWAAARPMQRRPGAWAAAPRERPTTPDAVTLEQLSCDRAPTCRSSPRRWPPDA